MAAHVTALKHSNSAPDVTRERKLSDLDERVDLTQTEAFKQSNAYVDKLSKSLRYSEEKKRKCDEKLRIAYIVALFLTVIALTLILYYYYPPIK